MALLAPTAQLHVGEVVVDGAAAIGEYVATGFDFDRNDCDTVVVEHGVWVAGANTFTNTTTDAAIEGVNVFEVDEDGMILHHYAHLDARTETSPVG